MLLSQLSIGFFENEIEGIILEDDCVPNKSFFLYVEDLLSHYRDDKRVMAISGNNILGDSYKSQFSYTFSRYSLMWGLGNLEKSMESIRS